MSPKPKYRPLDYNDPDAALDSAVALVQAAQILDVAMELAVRFDNTDVMLNTAAMWMKIGEMLDGGAMAEPSEPVTAMGFQLHSISSEEEEILEDYEELDE